MEAGPCKRRKAMIMMKETTKPLAESKIFPFPVEVWVKIFNYLRNHDIRFGVSLVCKKFHEICQDELLVPVKDLCIYGHPVGGPEPKEKDHKQYYRLSGGHRRNAVVAVSDV